LNIVVAEKPLSFAESRLVRQNPALGSALFFSGFFGLFAFYNQVNLANRGEVQIEKE